jgi:hypothetical protein
VVGRVSNRSILPWVDLDVDVVRIETTRQKTNPKFTMTEEYATRMNISTIEINE